MHDYLELSRTVPRASSEKRSRRTSFKTYPYVGSFFPGYLPLYHTTYACTQALHKILGESFRTYFKGLCGDANCCLPSFPFHFCSPLHVQQSMGIGTVQISNHILKPIHVL